MFCAQGMAPAENYSEALKSFVEAIRTAGDTGNIDALRKCVNELPNLNAFKPFGFYPLQCLLHEPYGSDLVITALERGARPDLIDLVGGTVLHDIVYSIDRRIRAKISKTQKNNFSPYQNLLSVIALPTYCYNDTQEGDEVLSEAELKDKALRSPCSVVNTFLMCLNKKDAPCARLKQVKPCILKYLIDASCSQKIFNITFPFMDNPEQLITRFPFERFASLAQTKNDQNDREKFVAFYAPLFARYRLMKAAVILQAENNEGYNASEEARREVPIFMNQGDTNQAVQLVYMAYYLHPIGFVERHLPACTKIIKNKLLCLDPFDGFPELNEDIKG